MLSNLAKNTNGSLGAFIAETVVPEYHKEASAHFLTSFARRECQLLVD